MVPQAAQTWRFRGSYKSPNMGYKSSYPTYKSTHEPPSASEVPFEVLTDEALRAKHRV